jgi:hypothetical protein
VSVSGDKPSTAPEEEDEALPINPFNQDIGIALLPLNKLQIHKFRQSVKNT